MAAFNVTVFPANGFELSIVKLATGGVFRVRSTVVDGETLLIVYVSPVTLLALACSMYVPVPSPRVLQDVVKLVTVKAGMFERVLVVIVVWL